MREVPTGPIVSEPPATDVRHGRLLHVDPARQEDLSFERIPGHGIPDVFAPDLADPVDRERAVVAFVLEIDLRGLHRIRGGERRGKDCEDAPAFLAARDSFDRLPLRRLRLRIDIHTALPAAHMNSPRPPEAPSERHAVELRSRERSLANMPGCERLAVAGRRERIEVARAPPCAIAALNVFGFQVPLRRGHRVSPGPASAEAYFIPSPGRERAMTRPAVLSSWPNRPRRARGCSADSRDRSPPSWRSSWSRR